MKIYFGGSIRAGREDAPLYGRMIEHLKKHGTVLTEHVGAPNVEIAAGLVGASTKNIRDACMEWLTQSDVLVAEVSKPSLGVGYEIGRAAAMSIPCLCLYRPDSYKGTTDVSVMIDGVQTMFEPEFDTGSSGLSAMIDGSHNDDSFIVKYYTEPEVFDIIDDYMKTLKTRKS